jgi:hypothetical protein
VKTPSLAAPIISAVMLCAVASLPFSSQTLRAAEARARKAPRHDWRIVLDGPLHGETYQRQGKNRWVLVEKNEGFA